MDGEGRREGISGIELVVTVVSIIEYYIMYLCIYINWDLHIDI